MPTLNCNCGAPIDVEEFEAGTSRSCSECGESNKVPSLARLRQLEGESNPYLNSTSRLIDAIAESRGPFDGRCLKCKQEAIIEYPVSTRLLKERVSSDSPIRMGSLGVTLDFSADEEWVHLKIPFRFCSSCASEFRYRTITGRVLLVLGTLAAVAIGIPLLITAHVFGIILFVPLIWGLAQVAGRTRVDRRLDPYVSRHPILQQVFAGQDELVVRVGQPADF